MATRQAVRFLIALTLAALCGCGGRHTATTGGGLPAGQHKPANRAASKAAQLLRPRLAGPAPRPRLQRAQPPARMRHLLPAKAYAALGQLAAPAPSSSTAGKGKGVSVVMPYFMTGGQQYTSGDAGYIDSHNADLSNPND